MTPTDSVIVIRSKTTDNTIVIFKQYITAIQVVALSVPDKTTQNTTITVDVVGSNQVLLFDDTRWDISELIQFYKLFLRN